MARRTDETQEDGKFEFKTKEDELFGGNQVRKAIYGARKSGIYREI